MTAVRLRPALLLTIPALLLGGAPPAQALDAAELRQRLEREMRGAGAFSGAYARDLSSGTELVAVRPDTPRIPASVEKLFVTAAALLRFGPDHQLATRAVTAGEIDEDGVLRGDLVLVGGGDPQLSEDALGRLALAVQRAGVSRVDGSVLGDGSAWDGLRGGPRTGFLPDRDIGGRLGALVLRRGLQPDPAAYAALRFAARLRAAGVGVDGRSRAGTAPEGATELASVGSTPVGSLIRLTNVPSDNFIAEMLLKALGAGFGGEGTTSAGAAVVRDTLDDLGLRPRIADGSGLSRANRTTPRQVVRLLERMAGLETWRTWTASLAVPGRTGTVKRRMRGTSAFRCRVKTGTIRGVSNLAGICTNPSGRDVAFAWLMNGVSPYGARRIQDRMTAALATYEGPPAP